MTGQSDGEEAIRQAKGKAEPGTAELDYASLDEELAWYQQNDYGNAQRLLKRFGEDLLHVPDVGWFAWDGKRWNYEEGARRAQIAAHKTAVAIRDEVESLEKEDNKKAAGALRRWARESGNHRKHQAMLAVAASYLELSIDELDADPWMLNCENCTLDLRNGVKRLRHDRGHRITKLAPVAYDPDQGYDMGRFKGFLQRIVPDDAMSAFLQRWYGYTLTGSIAEQKVVFFSGSGQNGKSTLVDLMFRIYGDYAGMINFSSLLYDHRKRGDEATPDLATLPGKRYVIATEPEKGVRFSAGTIKKLTEKVMRVRHLQKGFFEFQPVFKLCLSGNSEPSVHEQDEGIWCRLLLVKFDQYITEEEKEKGLEETLYRERTAILNWMLDGYRSWQEKGLCIPEAVKDATRDYREENDPIGLFLDECTQRKSPNFAETSIIYERYQKWAEKGGMKPMSQINLTKELKKRGVKYKRTGTARGFEGLHVLNETEWWHSRGQDEDDAS